MKKRSRMDDLQAVRQAAEIIRRGGIVVFPTETVYGVGADAFNPLAVARIFEVKRRPHFDPLIVHVASHDDLEKLVLEVPSNARRLMDRFWPGPLTVVLLKREEVPEIVTSGLSTIAVRMPDHPMALGLIERAGTPIAAPSANPFGYLSPTTAHHVQEQMKEQVDFILDGGPCEWAWNPPSSLFQKRSPDCLGREGFPSRRLNRSSDPWRSNVMRASLPLPGCFPDTMLRERRFSSVSLKEALMSAKTRRSGFSRFAYLRRLRDFVTLRCYRRRVT